MVIVKALLIPIVFLFISRYFCNLANYRFNVLEWRHYKNNVEEWQTNKQAILNQKHGARKFYQLGIRRYILVSFLCKEKQVAKIVVITSVISYVICLALVLCPLLNVLWLEIVAWCLGGSFLFIELTLINFNDKRVWTVWGTKRH